MTTTPAQPAQGPYRMSTELIEALEILSIGMSKEGVRCYPGGGGLWFGRNREFADATFVDWGLARAVATILTEAHATARLLAASWDLLEALKELLPEGWGVDDTMDHMPGVKKARLAIAKATGGESVA